MSTRRREVHCAKLANPSTLEDVRNGGQCLVRILEGEVYVVWDPEHFLG